MGNGTYTDSNKPVKVLNLTGIKEISTSSCSSLALRSDGKLMAWGCNGGCNLGNDFYYNKYFPFLMKNLTDIVSISAGFNHSLAIKKDGSLWAWGHNMLGQLGIGENNHGVSTPTQVVNIGNVISADAGGEFSIALDTYGNLWTWGNNYNGQLGNGTFKNSNIPIKVPNLSNIISVSAGYNYALALRQDGTVWAWGKNTCGELGNGTYEDSNIPVQVLNLFDIVSVSAGYFHALALKADGTVWAWGCNSSGQLGIGNRENRNIPDQVLNLDNIISISAGQSHSIALKNDGSVWTWGSNVYGELGIDENSWWSLEPIPLQSLNDIISISAGASHSLVLKKDGSVWAWGYNNCGQLGIGDTLSRNVPIMVSKLSKATKISAGYFISFAIAPALFKIEN